MCRQSLTGLGPVITSTDLSIDNEGWTCAPLETFVDVAKIGYYVTRALLLLK